MHFSKKYTEGILSNSTRKLLLFENNKMPVAVKNKFIALFIIIFGTLSLLVCTIRLSLGCSEQTYQTQPKTACTSTFLRFFPE